MVSGKGRGLSLSTLEIQRHYFLFSLAPNSGAPIGREKVITCFGIVGIVSLATSKYSAVIAGRRLLY